MRPAAVGILFAVSCYSQVTGQSADIFGYYEPQYTGIGLNNEYYQLFSNKLRIDLTSDVSNNIQFAANFDLMTYHGKTEWYTPDLLPDRISDSLAMLPPQLLTFPYEDTIFLDNAYIRVPVGRFDITVGKQQISLGTGYVWNPTDLFNYKSLVDPTYEQPGHNAIRIDVSPVPRYNLTVIVQAGKTLKKSTKLVRLKGGLGHFDISGIFIEKESDSYEYLALSQSKMTRRLFGGDFVGEVLGLGVWGEAGYNDFNKRNELWELDFGADYTLDNGLYLLAEYYYNGFGKSDSDDYSVNDWLLLLDGRIKSISRDNIYLYADYPLTDLIHLNNSIIYSVSDGSVALVPGLAYDFSENLDLIAFLNFNTGKKSTAYSTELGQSGLLRLRYYF